MYSWAPPGNLNRNVSYTPLDGQPLANQFATVGIVYSVPDAAKIPGLVQLAFDASLTNGYDRSGRRDTGGTTISLSIQAAATAQGISLIFHAPGN